MKCFQGVTYCGESKASNLTMENVPWHEEVVGFVEQLAQLLYPDYRIASEHAHSNCVLLAHTKVLFFITALHLFRSEYWPLET